jgi:hypothetical protein
MISMARIFGAPARCRPEARRQRIHRIQPVADIAFDIGDQMHHMAVAFDEEAVGDRHRAGLGDAADIVAAQIDQHQMLGAFLGIGHQIFGQRLVFLRRLAARAGASDGADRDLAAAQPHQHFRAGAHDLESRHRQVIKIGRRIEAAQGAIERKGRQRERAAEALAGHHLKHIARHDIFLGARHDGEILVLGHVGFDRHTRGQIGRHFGAGRGRAFQLCHGIVQPRGGAGVSGL